MLVAGVLLAVVAIFDSGGILERHRAAPAADGSTGCQLEVTTDQLNVRAGPSQDAELLRTLARGDGSTAPGSRPTSTASWRTARWAVTEFLTPVPGSNCT